MAPAAVALKFPAPVSAYADPGVEPEQEITEHQHNNVSPTTGRTAPPADAPTDIAVLRAEVATVVAGGRGAGPAWPTGVTELDAALGGGVPRGRVTEVVGSLGAGKTSLVRQLVARVLAAGGWVAWVDATRTLAPQELAGLGERLVMVRPRDHTRGAWCADLLLRSGVFALVVLDGAPVLSRVVGVRLSQLAREQDAAFVVLREGTQASRLGGAVRLQLRPSPVHRAVPAKTASPLPAPARLSWVQRRRARDITREGFYDSTRDIPPKPEPEVRTYSVLVEKGGSYRTVEVTCAIVLARRVCTHSEIPDRRGVARRTRAADVDPISERPARQAADEHPAPAAASADSGSELPAGWKGRGRARVAESEYGRFTRGGEARRRLHARSGEYHEPGHEGRRSHEPTTTALGHAATSAG